MTAESVSVQVPASGGQSVLVPHGATLVITDPCGGQVGDLFAFAAEDPGEYLSASHTRAALSRLWPRPGESFVTNRRRPILTLTEDASPGRHDMLIAACDTARYTALGAPEHASCAANLHKALARRGLTATFTPQPVNIFMDIRPDTGGDLSWHPASTAAGDSLTLRAEMPLLLVVSACPQDIAPVNAGSPTPLTITVHAPHTTTSPAPQPAT